MKMPAPSTAVRLAPVRHARRAGILTSGGTLTTAAVGVAVFAGYLVVVEPGRAKYAAAVPLLLLALCVPPPVFFGGWLLFAPLVQGAGNGGSFGHIWFKGLYLVPPLIVGVRMLTGAARLGRLWFVDAVPGLYLGYLAVSTHLFPSSFASPALITYKSLYIAVGVGVIAYYVIAFLDPAPRLEETVAAVLLWGGNAAALLGIVDGLLKWNPWNQVVANGSIYRAVSTFSNPAEFGTFLGITVVFAVAVLCFDGPRRLRRPATLLLLLAGPALFLTYTRGPVLATVVVAASLALLGRKARIPTLLLCALVGVIIFGSWGRITASSAYRDRLAVSTVRPRVVLSDVALELFRRRPVFGEGYGTFDQVKLTLPVAPGDAAVVTTTTSHDSFLTVLAETGAVGLLLILLPWGVLTWRATGAALAGSIPRWVVAASSGTLVVYALSAVTYDTRFFSFMTALPWIALGLERRLLARRDTLEPGV